MKMKLKKYIRVVLSLTLLASLVGINTKQTFAQEMDPANNGLELNKTVKQNADGTSTINLEAYTTGTVTTIVKSKPADIVLILDQSGSMSEKIKTEMQYTEVYLDGSTGAGTIAQKGKSYYIKTKKGYEKVTYKSAHYGEKNYIWIRADGKTEITPTNRDGSSPDKRIPALQMYDYVEVGVGKTKLEALQEAANIFIDNIIKDGGDHRIAIAGFASGSAYNYENTELFIGANEYNYGRGHIEDYYKLAFQSTQSPEGQKKVKSSISSLSSSGATRADLGLEMANEILDENPKKDDEKRQKVVLMFTDGQPTSSNGFDSYVANTTISNSKDIKENGAKVYTVGVVDTLDNTQDPSNINTNDMNRYMQYVSSNYPNATSLDDAGEGGDYTKGNFLAATDSEGLSNIFGKISEDISSTPMDLDKTAIFKDVMSDYFINPKSSDIKVYTSKCTGKDSQGRYTWGSKVVNQEVRVETNDNVVDVTGFDYKENYVAIHETTKKPQGSKLIVEITTRVIDGFIGGDDVPTNQLTSGIYVKDKLIEAFPLPVVDIATRFELSKGNDAGIYIGSKDNDLMPMFDADLSLSGLQYKIGDKTYTLNGVMNAFVDITYTILQNNVVIGEYVVSAGQTSGSWKSHVDLSEMINDTDFQVKANVVATKNSNNKVNVTETGRVYVYKPSLKTKNDIIFLGESVDLDKRITGVEWINNDRSAVAPTTPAPKLTYQYFDSDSSLINDSAHYKPIETEKVTVDTFNEGKDITAYTIVENGGIYTNVVKGELSITKKINKNYTLDKSIKANQTFIFKIDVREEKNGAIKETFYQTMDFSVAEGKTEKTINLFGLSKGYYSITEVSDWSWKYQEDESKRLDNYTGNGMGISENTNLFIGERSNDNSNIFYGTETGTEYKGKNISNPAITNFSNNLRNTNILGDVANARNLFTKTK